MPFPEIHACLISEDVRLERRGLSTLIGLYGSAPHVHILVRDLNTPISKLTFMLLGGAGQGEFKLSLVISDEQGEFQQEMPEVATKFTTSEGRNTVLVLGIQNLKFPHLGKYNIILKVDGNPHFRTSFQIEQGEEKDFI